MQKHYVQANIATYPLNIHSSLKCMMHWAHEENNKHKILQNIANAMCPWPNNFNVLIGRSWLRSGFGHGQPMMIYHGRGQVIVVAMDLAVVATELQNHNKQPVFTY